MTFERGTPPAPPGMDDEEAENAILAPSLAPPTPKRQGERALRDALRQWMIFTGVIGVGLLALVLTLTV